MSALTHLIGAEGRADIVVGPKHTARVIGSGGDDVLATPVMIALMEEASVNALAGNLRDGQTSLGTGVDIEHTAATPIGYRAWATASVVAVGKARVYLRVEAFDDAGPIGAGEHVRVVVDKERFEARLDEKRAQVVSKNVG
jgi:fluoroacetyl-CoA thioesterase